MTNVRLVSGTPFKDLLPVCPRLNLGHSRNHRAQKLPCVATYLHGVVGRKVQEKPERLLSSLRASQSHRAGQTVFAVSRRAPGSAVGRQDLQELSLLQRHQRPPCDGKLTTAHRSLQYSLIASCISSFPPLRKSPRSFPPTLSGQQNVDHVDGCGRHIHTITQRCNPTLLPLKAQAQQCAKTISFSVRVPVLSENTKFTCRTTRLWCRSKWASRPKGTSLTHFFDQVRCSSRCRLLCPLNGRTMQSSYCVLFFVSVTCKSD